MALSIDVLTAGENSRILQDLARLRISVFRDFPYLYDGDFDYEERYLHEFAKAGGAVIVVARDGTEVVGAATGAPLNQVGATFAEPFRARGADISRIFYCAESVLLPCYRGKGIGHAFFDHREAHAKTLGALQSCFCAVIRPPDHPARPAEYRPLDGFWEKRGYAPLAGARVILGWKDTGNTMETAKELQVWERKL